MDGVSRLFGWATAMILGILTVVGWFMLPHAARLSPIVMLLLWFNLGAVIVGLGLELGRRPYSLHLLHLVSLYLFLGAASLYQYSVGTLGVAGPIAGVRAEIVTAAASATLWIVVYVATYEIRRVTLRQPRSEFLMRSISISRALTLTAIAVPALVYLAGGGLIGTSTRGAAEQAIAELSVGAGAGAYTRTLYILIGHLLRPIPEVALLALLLLLLREPRTRRLALTPVVVVLLLGTAATNNPFAAPRIFLTATLIGFSAPFFLRRDKTGLAILAATLAGLTVLPALSASRNAFSLDELRHFFELVSPLDYLARNSDVDSLGMTALCQKWVDRFGHTLGIQILGALLFWVPRAVWPTKPIATGGMVTRDLGFDFTNLAPPIQSEALVDFGLLGVPFFAAIVALVFAKLDAVYWAPGRKSLGQTYRLIDVFYPFWLTCVVFLTRGDLFASLTFTVGFSVWMLPLGLRLLPTPRPRAPVPAASAY
jgi:hypothetical protein